MEFEEFIKCGGVSTTVIDQFDSPDILPGFVKYSESDNMLYGWAALNEFSHGDGNWLPYVDSAGDHFTANAIRKMAYKFAQGDGHLYDMHKNRVGKAIFNFPIVGPEIEKMGIVTKYKRGWAFGAEPENRDIIAKFKSGERTGFSVRGKPTDARLIRVSI